MKVPTYHVVLRAGVGDTFNVTPRAGDHVHPSQRQIAQQSLFLIQGSVHHSLVENALQTFGAQIEEFVKCYPIEGGCRGEILRDLRLMNITRASLFPGLDGFAQSLKYALIEEEPQETYKRQRRKELKLDD